MLNIYRLTDCDHYSYTPYFINMPQYPFLTIMENVPAAPDEFAIRSARREELNFFWEPDFRGLWSSPNARYLALPLHNPSVDGDHGLIRDYFRAPRKIRWLQALQPFLAFWPRYPEWTGVFSRLNLTTATGILMAPSSLR